MPLTDPFEEHTERYDRWFETYDHEYRSEVLALQRLVIDSTDGVGIGVGTGRFADPLGIRIGLDPSDQMLQRAAERGIEVVKGVTESLPFEDDAFNTALIVATICFVDDVPKTLEEARRILSRRSTRHRLHR